MLDTLGSHGRYARRSLLKQPGLTAIAVLVMALGIGGVTVMYSTLEAVVLRPLPYAEPERLVWAWSLTPASQQNTVSAVDYLDYRAELDAFESLAAYYALGANAVLTGGGQPERVQTTGFAPLAVLGAYVREQDLLSPVFSRLAFDQRMHTEEPVEAFVDIWVSMLAGCRSIHQVNTRIRPEVPLAKAWGRERFCERLPWHECWMPVKKNRSSDCEQGWRRYIAG